ncbi:COP1-interacting protein [Salix suchowensis]|nr:COP1-interacting protein [Salix suchowensis]
MADSNTVFIDTTLDTHLALIVSASDTVSDLKKKILHEHKLCFPTNGDIKIHALKVKRRGIPYHLSESMFVKSAFDGTGKNWFVSVDASTIEENTDNLPAQVLTTNNPSVDEVNLLPDSHPKSLFNVIDLSLQLDESCQLAKQKASVAEQICLDVAGNEELNNSSIVAYKGDCYRKLMPLTNDNNGSDPPILEKYDEPGKEDEVQTTPTGGVGGVSGNGIGNMQGGASPDGALTTGSGAKKKNKRKRKSKDVTDDLAGKEEASVCQSGENESQQESAANKRRKIEEDSRGDGSVKENEIVLSDSNKGISKHPTISQNLLVNNQKNTNSALHCLSSETLDGLSLPAASQISGKGKKKKKPVNPLNLETAAVPSSTDAKGESMEVNPKDFSKEPDTVHVPVQGVTISESCAVSVKEKHTDPVQEGGRPSSQGESTCSPELATASAANKRSSKNTILDDSQKHASDQVDGLEEERKALHPGSMPHEKCEPSDTRFKEAEVNSSELVEASETVYHGAHSKKRKKSKRTRALSSTAPTLRNENVKSSAAADAASIEPHKDVNGFDSNDKGNQEDSNLAGKEMEKVSEMDKEVVVTSQLAGGSEVVNPGTPSKKKKKSKRTRDLSSRTPGSGTENANSSAAAATTSTDHPKAASGDDSKDKVNEEESNLHAKEGKEVVEMDKVAVTSDLVEASETVNPGIPSKKRKKSKRTTDLLIRTPALGTEHVNSSAIADAASTGPLEAVYGNDSNDKVNQEGINLLAKEGKEVLEMDKVGVTSELGEASEAVNHGTPSKKRKKSKQTRDLLSGTPTSGTEPNSSLADTHPTEPYNSVYGDNSNDNGNKEKNSMAAKKGKVVLEMDAASTFRLATDMEIDDVIENVVKSAVNACPSKIDHPDKAGHGMEVSCGSDRINFNKYFVPGQDHSKTAASGEVLVDKATKAKEVGGVNSNKKKKLDAHSFVSSFDLHGSSRLDVNDGIGEKPPAGRVKVPPSSKSDKINSTPAEARKSGALRHVVTNTFARRGSDKERNQTNGREVSPADVKGVGNSSQRRKSLIGKSGTIFQDDNYENSAEDRTDSSDSSTRTPDNSLSSDYSDGESSSDFSSSQNGNYRLKSREGGGKNFKKPLSSGLTLEKILRSSSGYKKAKLTVSQSQHEDTESEPVDFVPDSQANP